MTGVQTCALPIFCLCAACCTGHASVATRPPALPPQITLRPINPSDILVIKGFNHSWNPKELPAVPGLEGGQCTAVAAKRPPLEGAGRGRAERAEVAMGGPAVGPGEDSLVGFKWCI